MIVNVFIYIERCKDVKCVAEVYLPGNSGIPSKDRKEVCGTNHGINMNNVHDLIPVVVEIRLNDPHAVVRVGVIEGFAVVVDECTRKNLIANLEREKKVDSGNVQAS